MELFRIGFLPVTVIDLVDITLATTVVYQLYRFFRQSILPQVFFFFMIFFLFWRLVELLNMSVMETMMGEFLQVGTLALVVIFAPELRRLLLIFSRNTIFDRLRRQLSENISMETNAAELINALEAMAAARTGALIVLVRNTDLSHIEQTGDILNADVSKRLLVSIFNTNSPLHDGAALIQKNRITAARCVLPISDDPTIPPEFGLRHRAAVGITEASDAIALVVSEETGKIAMAEQGKLRKNLNREQLQQVLANL